MAGRRRPGDRDGTGLPLRPGVQDINEIRTMAEPDDPGRIGERAADYDCELDVPTGRSLVMTATRETLAAAYSKAGHPEAYTRRTPPTMSPTSSSATSHISRGRWSARNRPPALYMGSFFARSLILAETGNAIGAHPNRRHGSAGPAPFFVAACDYTLIEEEFFAASASSPETPTSSGLLKGQDFGKFFVAVVVTVEVLLGLAAAATASQSLKAATAYLRNSVLGE